MDNVSESFEKLEIKENAEYKKEMNVLDLFCGCGGMSYGLTKAGLNVVAGIDIWNKAIESYIKNNKHIGVCEDIKNLSPQVFESKYLNGKKIDILVGGPPCQSFSIAGKRDKNDPRNSLFMEYVKYINYFNPKAFIMENVIGILSMKISGSVTSENKESENKEQDKKAIDIIMCNFTNYNTIICKLYASDFDVPQNRRRVIIFGIRKDLNIIPTEPKIPINYTRPTVKNILQPQSEIDKSYYLSERALTGIKNKKEKSKSMGNGFGAQYLDLDKPSYTIPARYWKDGYDALVKYSDTSIRRLTILELKRIQSFPDDYQLEGSKKEQIIQIGNAVACNFAYHLGKHLIKMLSD